MVIFNSYVKLPEGTYKRAYVNLRKKLNIQWLSWINAWRCWNQASSDAGWDAETEVWVHFVWLLAYETLLLLSQPFGNWFRLSIDQNLLHLVTRWHSNMGPNLPNLMKIPFTGPLPQAFHSNPVRMGEVASLSVPENVFKKKQPARRLDGNLSHLRAFRYGCR